MYLSRRALLLSALYAGSRPACGQQASMGGFAAERLRSGISQWLKTFDIHRHVGLIEMRKGAGAGLLAGRWLEAAFWAVEWSGDALLRQRASAMLDRVLGAQREGTGAPFPEMTKADVRAMASAMEAAVTIWSNGPAAALADRLGADVADRQGLDAAAVIRLEDSEKLVAAIPQLRQALARTGDGVWGDSLEFLLWNQIFALESAEGDAFRAAVPFRGPAGEFGGEKAGSAGALLLSWVPWLYYSADADRVWVHQYGQSEANVEVAGRMFRLAQATSYPETEDIVIEIRSGTGEFELRLRIPAWCPQASIAVNRAEQPVSSVRGYAALRRNWQPGDLVQLRLPMSPEWRTNDAGELEFRRGPLLYRLEAPPHARILRDTLRKVTTPPDEVGSIYQIRVILEGKREELAFLKPFATLGWQRPGTAYSTAMRAE